MLGSEFPYTGWRLLDPVVPISIKSPLEPLGICPESRTVPPGDPGYSAAVVVGIGNFGP